MTSCTRKRFVALATAALATMTAPDAMRATAWAQRPPTRATSASARFEAAMDEAQQKMASGDTRGALEAYRRAFAISSAGWLVAANRANAADQLGLYVEAAQMYRHALGALSPADEAYAEYQPKLVKRLRAAEAKVGQLVLNVSRPGAEVLLEGQPVGRAPLPGAVYAMPGTRDLQVLLPGYDTFTWRGNVVAGQTVSLDVTLTRTDSGGSPAPLPSAPPPDQPDQGMSDAQLGLGIAGIGLGAGGVIAAVVLGLTASGRADDVSRLQSEVDTAAGNGGGGNSCGIGSPFQAQCAELSDVADEEATLRGAAIGAGITGGVLLVAGIVTLALPLSGSGGEGDQSLRFRPIVRFGGGPDGGRLSLTGWF